MFFIEKKIDDLTIHKWKFIELNSNIYLDGFYILKRESKKHKKYATVKRYERISERDSNILESEVPFTTEIRTEAFDTFVKQIKVLKWSERIKIQ